MLRQNTLDLNVGSTIESLCCQFFILFRATYLTVVNGGCSVLTFHLLIVGVKTTSLWLFCVCRCWKLAEATAPTQVHLVVQPSDVRRHAESDWGKVGNFGSDQGCQAQNHFEYTEAERPTADTLSVGKGMHLFWTQKAEKTQSCKLEKIHYFCTHM